MEQYEASEQSSCRRRCVASYSLVASWCVFVIPVQFLVLTQRTPYGLEKEGTSLRHHRDTKAVHRAT